MGIRLACVYLRDFRRSFGVRGEEERVGGQEASVSVTPAPLGEFMSVDSCVHAQLGSALYLCIPLLIQ